MIRGLILGKFYPPHAGHRHIIDQALAEVDQLTILVCQKKEFTIPTKLRVQWLQEMYPPAVVKIIDQDSFEVTDAQAWADQTLQILGFTPDKVFSSEDYGELYAQLLGATHHMVDKDRLTVHCSASAIRANPQAYLHLLEPAVQAYFLQEKAKSPA